MAQGIEALTNGFHPRPIIKESEQPKSTMTELLKHPYALAATAVRTRREQREQIRHAKIAQREQELQDLFDSIPQNPTIVPLNAEGTHVNRADEMIQRRAMQDNPTNPFDQLLKTVAENGGETSLETLPSELQAIAQLLHGVISLEEGVVKIPSLMKPH